MTSVQKLNLTVPATYSIDPWFHSASPEEIALVLDLAGRLPRIVGDEKNDMAAKLYAARQDGTTEAIKKVLEEASNIATTKLNGDITSLTTEIQMLQLKNEQLQEEHNYEA